MAVQTVSEMGADMNERFVQDGKLEARVESTSQNAKGWYIRLLLHPSDTEEVTKLRVGAVLDIRWREVLNVEVEPIEVEVSRGGSIPDLGTVPRPQANEAGISKPKKRFEEYPLSAQCAMRCEDANFMAFLVEEHAPVADAAGKVRFLCGVKSRAELDTNPLAADLWKTVEAEYQQFLTDQRHAESIRR